MLGRRSFLLLLGGAVGLLVANRLAFSQELTLVFGGRCSFCGKNASEVLGLAVAPGRAPRVCNECLSLCVDIIAEEELPPAPPLTMSKPLVEAQDSLVSSREILEAAVREAEATRQSTVADARPRVSEPACSFCDLSRRECEKLITGPNEYICNGCIHDGWALFPSALRTS